MSGELDPFHMAVPVHDLAAARAFYGDMLGCPEGRSSATWVDFNLFGHQFVAHLDPTLQSADRRHNAPVDDNDVSPPHFGVVLKWNRWQERADRLQRQGVQFVIEPYRASKGRRASRPQCFSSTFLAMRSNSRHSRIERVCS